MAKYHNKHFLWGGIVILAVAVALGFRASLKPASETGGGNKIAPPNIFSNRAPHEPSSHPGKRNRVNPDYSGPSEDFEKNYWNSKPLDWNLEELDKFLSRKSKELDSSDLATLIVSVLPDPAGAEEMPNRLKPGSISLSDQKTLVDRYLTGVEKQGLYTRFWQTYGRSGHSDEYQRLFVDPLPQGPSRSSGMGACYLQKYPGYAGVKQLLASEDLKTLKNLEASQGTVHSDYSGVAQAIEGVLVKTLEQGEASADEIVRILESSGFDPNTKVRLTSIILKYNEKLKQGQSP